MPGSGAETPWETRAGQREDLARPPVGPGSPERVRPPGDAGSVSLAPIHLLKTSVFISLYQIAQSVLCCLQGWGDNITPDPLSQEQPTCHRAR